MASGMLVNARLGNYEEGELVADPCWLEIRVLLLGKKSAPGFSRSTTLQAPRGTWDSRQGGLAQSS